MKQGGDSKHYGSNTQANAMSFGHKPHSRSSLCNRHHCYRKLFLHMLISYSYDNYFYMKVYIWQICNKPSHYVINLLFLCFQINRFRSIVGEVVTTTNTLVGISQPGKGQQGVNYPNMESGLGWLLCSLVRMDQTMNIFVEVH